MVFGLLSMLKMACGAHSHGAAAKRSFAKPSAVAVMAAAVFATLTALAGPADAALVFDNMTGNGTAPSLSSTGSTPNTFMGDGYTLAPGTTDITGFDLFPVNLSGTNFTNLELVIYVWGGVNTGTVSAATPAFSNLLGQYTLTSAGTFTSGFYYSFVSANPGVTPGISLATPLIIPSTTVGITLNFEGSTNGTTYSNVNSLTSIISTGAGAAPTVGSDVFNGYYRNANSETNGDFTSTLRSLGLTNQSLGLRVYGDVAAVPEPASLGLASLAGLALLRRRRRML